MDISNYGQLLPFDMEDVLCERNAKLVVCTKETMSQNDLVVVSDAAARLVTGSFAKSAGEVAVRMHRLLAVEA